MGIYAVKNTSLKITVDSDDYLGTLITLPSVQGHVTVRLAKDGFANPMTDGDVSEQMDHNKLSISKEDSPLMGWGDHDCRSHWVIDGHWVANHVIDALDVIFKKPIVSRIDGQV